MKKLYLAVLAGALCIPAFAQEATKAAEVKANQTVEQNQAAVRPGSFKEMHEKQNARLKETQEKMKKLVSEYKQQKNAKKKEAKKAEIEKVVADIHEKQMEFKKKNLENFEQRLAKMKEEFAKQNTAQAKEQWVQENTDKLIEADGDIKALLKQPDATNDKGMFPGKPGMKPGMRPHHPGKRGQFPKPQGKEKKTWQSPTKQHSSAWPTRPARTSRARKATSRNTTAA